MDTCLGTCKITYISKVLQIVGRKEIKKKGKGELPATMALWPGVIGTVPPCLVKLSSASGQKLKSHSEFGVQMLPTLDK